MKNLRECDKGFKKWSAPALLLYALQSEYRIVYYTKLNRNDSYN
jgi:hypothetical protein